MIRNHRANYIQQSAVDGNPIIQSGVMILASSDIFSQEYTHMRRLTFVHCALVLETLYKRSSVDKNTIGGREAGGGHGVTGLGQ